MDIDKNIIDYDLPDYFTVFVDLKFTGDDDYLLEGCCRADFSLRLLISYYVSIHRDFQILFVPWNEIDPFFERDDCLIFGKVGEYGQ